MIFIKKKCKICGQERKFIEGTDRDKENICGNCWNWDFENT
jgi:hypothetical protein